MLSDIGYQMSNVVQISIRIRGLASGNSTEVNFIINTHEPPLSYA